VFEILHPRFVGAFNVVDRLQAFGYNAYAIVRPCQTRWGDYSDSSDT